MNSIIEPSVSKSLIEQCNPLGFYNDTQSLVFKLTTDSYIYMMQLVRRIAPRGYIELPWLLFRMYPKCKFYKCQLYAKEMRPLGLVEITLLSSYYDKHAQSFFERLAKALHQLAGTQFNYYFFMDAWRLFCYNQNKSDDEFVREIEKFM